MADASFYEKVVPLLRNVGLFSRCTEYELKVVARNCTMRESAPGDRIISLGDEGDQMYLLLSGTADASVEGKVLHTFNAGDYFGELAVLRPAPRTSDVTATSQGLLAVLGRNEMMLLLDSIPGVAKSMLQGLADTVREVKDRAAELRQ
ncbi:MAG: cyclic nucleotide-binding domain-containing protein [Actinomycetota bacterium]